MRDCRVFVKENICSNFIVSELTLKKRLSSHKRILKRSKKAPSVACFKSLRKTFQAWSRCRPPLKFVLAAELLQSCPAKICHYAHSTSLRMEGCNTHCWCALSLLCESVKLDIGFTAQYLFSGYKPLQHDPSSSCLSGRRIQLPRV